MNRVVQLFIFFALLGMNGLAFGQTTLRLNLAADGQTYSVCMQSGTSFTGIKALISSSQITICVPHGTGANRFEISNISSAIPNMKWELSTRIDAPAENPDYDYLFFTFINNASPRILFDMLAGVEICLFQFKRSSICRGIAFLVNNKIDPFSTPNSMNINMGNSLSVLGALGETYTGNTAAPPTASIVASITNACAEIGLDFKAQVSVPSTLYQYQWFVDNVAVSGQLTSPNFSYAFPSQVATYYPTLRLKVSIKGADICQSLSVGAVARLTIKASPKAEILYQGGNCINLPYTLLAKALAEVQYQWYQDKQAIVGANASSLAISKTGAYSLKITTLEGCSNTSKQLDLVGVSKSEKTSVSIGQSPKIVAGTTLQLNPIINNASSFVWSPSSYVSIPTAQNPVFSPKATTTYTLTALSADGCPAKDSVTIEVLPNLEIPEIFTPNNDGINDTWNIYNTQVHSQCQVTIYSRWGEVVYQNEDYQNPWDGTNNGVKMPMGAYIYVVRTPLATYRGGLEIVY